MVVNGPLETFSFIRNSAAAARIAAIRRKREDQRLLSVWS